MAEEVKGFQIPPPPGVIPDAPTPTQDLSAVPSPPGPLSAMVQGKSLLPSFGVGPNAPFPVVASSMKSQVQNPFPSITGMAVKNVRERYPQMAAQTAGTLVGNPYLGSLAAGGAMTGGKLLQGAPPSEALKTGGLTAGLGAGLTGVLQGATKTLGVGPLRRVFASDTMSQLGELLKSKVSALKAFKTDEKGVFQMLIGPRGFQKVHKWYDEYVQGAIKAGATKEITIPASAAEVLGIKVTSPDFTRGVVDPALRAQLVARGQLSATPTPGLQTGVKVNAAEAAQKMLGQWEKNPGEYQSVAKALDEAGIGDPAMREGYKTWVGLRNYMSQQKAFQGERYNPEKAMAGLTNVKQADQLSRRGLEEAMSIIRGPGKHPITETGINPWVKRATGGAVGEIGAEVMGLPRGLGWAPGLLAAEALVPQYRHVPIPQGLKSLMEGTTPQLAAQSAQKIMQIQSTDAQ